MSEEAVESEILTEIANIAEDVIKSSSVPEAKTFGVEENPLDSYTENNDQISAEQEQLPLEDPGVCF